MSKITKTNGDEYILHFGGKDSGDVKIIWHNRYTFIYQSDYNTLIIPKIQK